MPNPILATVETFREYAASIDSAARGIPTESVKPADLEIGDIVYFYGAFFRIEEKEIFPEDKAVGGGPVAQPRGRWIGGHDDGAYFGAKIERLWAFQGNSRASFARVRYVPESLRA